MNEPPAQPVFNTARLILRPLAESDAEGLHECYGDAGAMRYWDLPPSRDVAETARRIKQSLNVPAHWHAAWAVLARGDAPGGGRLVGMINYHHREPWNRRLEIGYILAPPHWRRGYMSEAMGVFLRHVFEGLGSHRVELTIEPGNAASIGLAEHLGFTRETGVLRDRLCVAGEYRSVLLYALLEPEWRARGAG
jgi:ribosomal-protein-alanine N-acetyltransferase